MKCIVVDDNEMALSATRQLVSRVTYLKLTGSFSDPLQALSFITQNEVDLIFLDIEMPEVNGLQFMQSLNLPHPLIILTTTHTGHALEAFNYNVSDYLVKPIDVSRFMKAVAKAQSLFEKLSINQIDKDFVFIKKGGMIVKVIKADILWIEGLGDYVSLHTEKEKFIVHSTMQAIEDSFSSKEFVRVHRSFIIRFDKIASIEDNTISCFDKLIPIGKTYLKDVYSKLSLL